MSMTSERFCKHYPFLYHMAEIDSWESIQKHGLLSTTALLDLFEITEGRENIESHRRPRSVEITHPKYGRAVIRDSKPISDSKLALCLEDMTIPEFYETLNRHVFFWTETERLNRLLCGMAYRNSQHIVLTVDALSLLTKCSSNTVLSRINSGAILAPSPRGRNTFIDFSEWPHEERSRAGGLKIPVVECAVKYGVKNITEHVLKVEEIYRDKVLKIVYEK